MASTQILYSKQVAKKKFSGATVKDAYMKACKWYASNIIAKDDLHEIQVEFKKNNEEKSVELIMYAVLSAEEVMQQHCTCCKEMHHAFFINEANNCNVCNAGAYERRMQNKIAVKVDYYRELLKRGGLI